MIRLCVAAVLLFSAWWFRKLKTVKGACYVPTFPIIGNAWQLRKNPSAVLAKWSQMYKNPVLVVHMGSVPVVVVNNHQIALSLWSSTALASRPQPYTFHHVVSAVQGLTVGTTPAGDSFRRKKRCLARHLPIAPVEQAVDKHSRAAIQQLLVQAVQNVFQCRIPSADTNMLGVAQNYVLGVAVEITYGTTLDCMAKHRGLAAEIVSTENHIIRTRALFANWQDFLPVWAPWLIRSAASWRDRRDSYMRRLYGDFEARMQTGDPKTRASILGRIASEKTQLTPAEIQSVCLTMVSAGLDNGSLTFNHIMGHFSHAEYGYAIQDTLHTHLIAMYGDTVSAWDGVVSVECDYAVAVIHEALRFFSVLPLGLPRLTTKPVCVHGVLIPQNTIVVMNSHAANHDESVFPNLADFDPDRWLENGKLKSANHMTFGWGMRRCSGDKLAMNELYTLLCRTVLLFHVRRPTDAQYLMDLDVFRSNACPTATSFEPKEFRVWLRLRHGPRISEIHSRLLR